MHTSASNSTWIGVSLSTGQSIVSYSDALLPQRGEEVGLQASRGGCQRYYICGPDSCRDVNRVRVGQSARPEPGFLVAQVAWRVTTDSGGPKCGAFVRAFLPWRKASLHLPDAVSDIARAHAARAATESGTTPNWTLIRSERAGGQVNSPVRIDATMPINWDWTAALQPWGTRRVSLGSRPWRLHEAPASKCTQSAQGSLMHGSPCVSSSWQIPRGRAPPSNLKRNFKARAFRTASYAYGS